MVSVEVAIPARASLGEGPAWDAEGNRLLWVDILENRLLISDLATGVTRERQFPEPVGAVIPTTTGEMILTTPSGIEWLSDLDATPTLLLGIEADRPANRMNDGKCDSRGRLWTGTMHRDADPAQGALYLVEPDLQVHRMLEDLTISNGLAFAPDESAVFFIDTPLRRIDRLLVEDRTIVSREAWADLAEWPGVPDGMTIDDEGCLWVAMFDGGCLLRVSPRGRVDRQVDLPVSWATSVAFAGPDLDTLMITTGRKPSDGVDTPGGSVLAMDPGVTGAASHPFALSADVDR